MKGTVHLDGASMLHLEAPKIDITRSVADHAYRINGSDSHGKSVGMAYIPFERLVAIELNLSSTETEMDIK